MPTAVTSPECIDQFVIHCPAAYQHLLISSSVTSPRGSHWSSNEPLSMLRWPGGPIAAQRGRLHLHAFFFRDFFQKGLDEM
jgi:hypothetical protein